MSEGQVVSEDVSLDRERIVIEASVLVVTFLLIITQLWDKSQLRSAIGQASIPAFLFVAAAGAATLLCFIGEFRGTIFGFILTVLEFAFFSMGLALLGFLFFNLAAWAGMQELLQGAIMYALLWAEICFFVGLVGFTILMRKREARSWAILFE